MCHRLPTRWTISLMLKIDFTGWRVGTRGLTRRWAHPEGWGFDEMPEDYNPDSESESEHLFNPFVEEDAQYSTDYYDQYEFPEDAQYSTDYYDQYGIEYNHMLFKYSLKSHLG